MRWTRRLLLSLRALLRRDRIEREMDAELRFHFEQQVVENLAAHMPLDEARRSARLRFGDLEAIKDGCRDAAVWTWTDALWRDLREGGRNLRKSPGLVAISMLSLGLGIGLNIALYSAVTVVFGHRPTMVDPDSMFGIEIGEGSQVSYPNLRDVQASGVFASVAGFRAGSMTLRAGEASQRLSVIVVTDNYFEALGIQTARGRTIASTEASTNPLLVVIGHNFWLRALGADPDVVGRALMLDGEPFTVVGVLSQDHRTITGFVGADAYVLLNRLTLPALDDRDSAALAMVARLRPGTTIAQALTELTALCGTLAHDFPQQNEALAKPPRLRPARALQFGSVSMQIVSVLLGFLFLLVLLIGCANVAGMLLARAVSRRHELSIRAALGADRRRIFQSLLVESLLLALLGSAAGLGLFLALRQARLPQLEMIGRAMLSPNLWLVSVGLAVVTALLCGVAPAFAATRADALAGTRYGAGQFTTPRLGLRNAFVVAQVALSLLLLVIAALCLRSQMQILSVDVGFDLDRGVVAWFELEPGRYAPDDRQRLARAVVDRLERLPEITSASVAAFVPLGGESLVRSFHPAGRSDIPGTRPSTYSVGPAFFQTMGIRLVHGREFAAADNEGSVPVAIVNETFARTYFPAQAAIGHHFQTGTEADAEIIGVVADNKIDTIGELPKSVLYYPWAQRPRNLIVHARTAGPPEATIPIVARAIREVDESADVTLTTRSQATSLEMTMRRTGTLLMGAIGGAGLVLTLIGLYGVVAYMVASRTTEMGLRSALGATPSRLRGEVLWYAGQLVTYGVVFGTAATLMLAPALRTFLAGFRALDLVVYATTTVVLLLVSLVAAYVPARRALRVDPITALRLS